MKSAALCALLVVVVSSIARAQEPPTPPAPGPPLPPAPTADEIRRVSAYYLKGKESGPILIELSLCADIGKTEEGKLACGAPLPTTLKKGDAITAFVKFFAPKGGKYEDLKIKFLVDGEVRSTSDFTVTESWTGYANYKKTTANKLGTWEVQVLRGDVVLESRKIGVE